MKDITAGTRVAGVVISRKQILNIGKDVVKVNNLNSLIEFDITLELINPWVRDFMKQLAWSKRKGTTEKN